jgi:hypothetical protein
MRSRPAVSGWRDGVPPSRLRSAAASSASEAVARINRIAAEVEASEGEIAVTITTFDHDFTIDELDVQLLSGANEVVEGTFDATPGTHVLSCVVLTLNPDTPRRGWRER